MSNLSDAKIYWNVLHGKPSSAGARVINARESAANRESWQQSLLKAVDKLNAVETMVYDKFLQEQD